MAKKKTLSSDDVEKVSSEASSRLSDEIFSTSSAIFGDKSLLLLLLSPSPAGAVEQWRKACHCWSEGCRERGHRSARAPESPAPLLRCRSCVATAVRIDAPRREVVAMLCGDYGVAELLEDYLSPLCTHCVLPESLNF